MSAFRSFTWKPRRRFVAALSAIALGAWAGAPATEAATLEELRPLDDSERGLIATLNDERQVTPGPTAEPLRRLTVAPVLNQAASDYADHLRAAGLFDHHADGRTAAERAGAAGWTPAPGPGLSVGENLFDGPSAELAYNWWKASAIHNAVMFHPDAYSVGIGHSGTKWVLLVAGRCDGNQCATTTVGGDSNARVAAPPRPARLRILLRRRGRTVGVRVKLLRGEGQVRVQVRRADGRSARRLRASRRDKLWRCVARLERKGRWRIIVRFSGRPGWSSKVVRLRPFTVRAMSPRE